MVAKTHRHTHTYTRTQAQIINKYKRTDINIYNYMRTYEHTNECARQTIDTQVELPVKSCLADN